MQACLSGDTLIRYIVCEIEVYRPARVHNHDAAHSWINFSKIPNHRVTRLAACYLHIDRHKHPPNKTFRSSPVVASDKHCFVTA